MRIPSAPVLMNELPISGFQKAIKVTHGAQAELVERVRVVEELKDERVWEGEVLVFRLLDHPTAPKVYAWEVDGEVTTVLHEGPVDGPQAAVRAAILTG